MNQKNKRLLIFGLIIIIASLFLSSYSDPTIPYLFSLKRSQEKVFQKLQLSDEQKLNFNQNLLNARLLELQSIVNTKSYPLILQASLRYSTTAGDITNLIINSGFKDKISLMQVVFSNHQKVFQQLIDNYPKDYNVEWKYLQDDFNYLKIYKDQLSKI